jgi:hypothetical protein
MKLSNYTPSKCHLTQEQKKLIEGYFFGGNEFTNAKGIILNKMWHIAQLTGIRETKISQYVDSVLYEKRKKMINNNG